MLSPTSHRITARLILALMFLSGPLLGQGIQFRNQPLSEVFTEARVKRVPVFIEIYSPTCHVCESFKPILDHPSVGKFYNANFISTRLDIGAATTQKWLKDNHLYVPSLPLFLFMDPSGKLQHFAITKNDISMVNQVGVTALNPQARSAALLPSYNAGNRDLNMLVDLAMWGKITCDTTINIQAMNDYARLLDKDQYGTMISYLVVEKVVMDWENPLVQYLIDHLPTMSKYGHTPTESKQMLENILMSSLYSGRGAKYSPAKVEAIRKQLVKIGIDTSVAAYRTLLPQIKALFREKQGRQAVQVASGYATNNPKMSVQEYLYFMRLFNKNAPDNTYVGAAEGWLNKAVARNPTPAEKADLYYELAEAQWKAKNPQALESAKTAMSLARTAGMDLKRHNTQLTLISRR